MRIVRKGKRKHKPHNDTRTNKAGKWTSRGQEDKPRTTKAKPQKIGEEDEKRKNRGEYATSHITA